MYSNNPLTEKADQFTLANNDIYRWIYNAVVRPFPENTTMFYCDIDKRELFSVFIFVYWKLTQSNDFEDVKNKLRMDGITETQKSKLISKIKKIDDNHSSIVEIQRLTEDEWNFMMETIIHQNNDTEDGKILKKNMKYIHENKFSLDSIMFPFLKDINSEKILDDCHNLFGDIANCKIYDFLKMIDNNLDADPLGVLNSFTIFYTNNIKMQKI